MRLRMVELCRSLSMFPAEPPYLISERLNSRKPEAAPKSSANNILFMAVFDQPPGTWSRIAHHVLRFPIGFSNPGKAGIPGAAFGPCPKTLNLFGHRARQGHGLAEDRQDVFGRELF